MDPRGQAILVTQNHLVAPVALGHREAHQSHFFHFDRVGQEILLDLEVLEDLEYLDHPNMKFRSIKCQSRYNAFT